MCRELGYSGADKATTHSHFGPAETPFQAAQKMKIPYTADEVSCKGNETSMSKCDHYVKSDCDVGEAAGVMCTLEVNGTKTRNKRAAAASLAAAAPAISKLAETGANIIGSAVEYFDRKENLPLCRQTWAVSAVLNQIINFNLLIKRPPPLTKDEVA